MPSRQRPNYKATKYNTEDMYTLFPCVAKYPSREYHVTPSHTLGVINRFPIFKRKACHFTGIQIPSNQNSLNTLLLT